VRSQQEVDWGRGAAVRSERAAVLASIDMMLQGMRTKDAALVRGQLDSLARMTLLRPAREGGVRVMALSGEEFVRVATAADQPPLDEPIRNPVVQIDGDLATVWAEYQVRRDGRVTHCGHDAFHLVRRQGRWRILNVSDTYRQQGCGAPW
jgi:ribosomal protein L36